MEHRREPRCYSPYSTVDFLNEALSYTIGHLHLDTSAKCFFNSNTTPSKNRQASYFRLGQQAREALQGLKKARDPLRTQILKDEKQD